MTRIFTKDPDETLDYYFDWSNTLAVGESIDSYEIVEDDGIILGTGDHAPAETDGVIKIWLSGGVDGTDYNIICRITVTPSGEVNEDFITIRVRSSTSTDIEVLEAEEVEGVSGWEEVNALSLYRYARILNINPVHLSTSGDISLDSGEILFPLEGTGRYYQERGYTQSERVSRQEIVEEIAYAESVVEDFLETFVVPRWVKGEVLDLKQHYDPQVGYTVYNVRGERVKYSPKWGNFIAGGKRKSAIVDDNVVVAYSDPDGDGWAELATIEFEADEDISLYELKVYFQGYEGSPQYEIKDPLTKSRDGTTVTITFETWKLIDPTLYDVYPTQSGNRVIDLTNASNIVDNVSIYRKYNDTTEPHAVFYYTTSNDQFEDSTQNGYIKIADPELNLIQLIPATYSDEKWSKSVINGTLRYVELNYLSGYRYRPSFGSNFWDELHPDLAQVIAYIATSRLSRPLAGKPETVALSTMLQKDLATSQRGEYRYVGKDDLENPFGTHAGEVYAWRRLIRFQKKFLRYNR